MTVVVHWGASFKLLLTLSTIVSEMKKKMMKSIGLISIWGTPNFDRVHVLMSTT